MMQLLWPFTGSVTFDWIIIIAKFHNGTGRSALLWVPKYIERSHSWEVESVLQYAKGLGASPWKTKATLSQWGGGESAWDPREPWPIIADQGGALSRRGHSQNLRGTFWLPYSPEFWGSKNGQAYPRSLWGTVVQWSILRLWGLPHPTSRGTGNSVGLTGMWSESCIFSLLTPW